MKKLVWLCVLLALVAGGAQAVQYLQRHRASRLGRVREMQHFAWLPKLGLSEQAFLEDEHERCFAPAFRIQVLSSRFDRGAYERCLDEAARARLGRLARLEQPYWSRQDQAWLRLDYTLRLTGVRLPENGLRQRQRYECAGEFVGGSETPVATSSFDEVAPGELIGNAIVGTLAVGSKSGCAFVLSLEIEGSTRDASPLALAPGLALASLRLPFPPAAQEIHEPAPVETPAPEPTPTPAPRGRKRR